MITSLPLFTTKKEWSIFFAVITAIFSISLFFEYLDYKEFKSSYRVETKVLAHYHKISKKGYKYYVLKCKNSHMTFYTTTYKEYENLKNRYISIIPNSTKVSFLDYLQGFYMPSKGIKILQHQDSYKKVYNSLLSLHSDRRVQEFYSAIFLGSHISKDTRESIAILGVSHLVAISGFHISILIIFIYAVLYFPYKYIQQRYFPYRNMKIDILLISICILLFYLIFVDFIPSLLRSYSMLLIGAFFLIRYIKILSFATLLIAVLSTIAIFPKMLFSVGFWFSVSGVFYIYLFIYYLKDMNKYLIAIAFNFWVFMAMAPIAHYYFGIFSIYQILSPMLTLLFSIFYPIVLLLHTVGIPYADSFDAILSMILSVQDDYIEVKTPTWLLISYIGISLASIFYLRAFILLNIFIFIFFSYLTYSYFR
jgi:competence protein ComEC